MASPFVAEIRMFGGNFAPRGWALCNGQTIPIPQNTALYALLSTYFGGNGTSTFALPNLPGSAVMSQGNGPGLTPRAIGDATGAVTCTLNMSQLAMHNHAIQAYIDDPAAAQVPDPTQLLGSAQGLTPYLSVNTPAQTTMNPAALSMYGNGAPVPHNNMQPYVCVNFIIALQGVFPQRG